MWVCVTLNNVTKYLALKQVVQHYIISLLYHILLVWGHVTWLSSGQIGGLGEHLEHKVSIPINFTEYVALCFASMAYECKLSNFNWCMNRQNKQKETHKKIHQMFMQIV